MPTEDTLHKIVLLLIKIRNPATIRAACLEKLDVPAEKVDAALDAARRLITRAADFHRDAEFGKSVLRLEELFKSCNDIKDYKTALATEKSRIHLLGLDRDESQEPETVDTESQDLTAIREHLEPLDLAPKGTPVVELARLAAIQIMNG